MRKLTTLIVAALASTLAWAPLTAIADDSDDDSGAGWNIGTDGGSSGEPDVTAHLWLNGKTGGVQGGDDSFSKIGGETQTEFNARMQAWHTQQAAFCARLFTDVQTRALLIDFGSIALRNQYEVQCLVPGMSYNDPPSPPPNPAVLGAEAVSQLTLPGAAPLVGPDPSVNKWNMVAIGFPIWLWTEGQTQLRSSASVRGYTVSLVATRTLVQFSLGDGTTVSCSATAAYAQGAVKPGTPSPNCGHVYQLRPDSGHYRVAALATWNVTWSVLGQSGTIPVTKGASRQLRVGELQAVVVR